MLGRHARSGDASYLWAARYVIPTAPGVYALYRGGAAVYVGKATQLQAHIWNNHLRQGTSMSNSALRRNVAETLEIASAGDIKTGIYEPSDEDAARVTDLIGEGEWAWTVRDSVEAAETLEKALKREWLPPLTKR